MRMKKVVLYLAILAACLCGCTKPVESTPVPPVAVAPATASSGETPTAISAPTQAMASPTALPPTETISPPAAPTPTETIPAPMVDAIDHIPGSTEIAIQKIHMHSASLGWATGGLAGANDHVLRTLDGGATWIDVTPPEPAPAVGEQRIAEAYFFDPDVAWVMYYTDGAPPSSPQVAVWRTQDGGGAWNASAPLETSDLNEFFTPTDLQFVDAQTGWLLAHVGVGMNHDYVALFRSSDGGQTWQRLIDPYGDSSIQSCSKTSMLFITPQEGWLTGDCNGVAPGVLLFKTVDGGTTWNPIELPPPASEPNLYSNDFIAACGAYTPTLFNPQQVRLVVRCVRYNLDPMVTEYYLYSSDDGGGTWSSTAYPGGALIFTDSQTGLALGKEIYKTSNGGQSWNRIGRVTWEGDFYFLNEQIGWAVARDGEQIALVQTSNGGQKWALMAPQTAP